jgi:hypothetical protein
MARDGSVRVHSQGLALPVDATARTTKPLVARNVTAPSEVSSGLASFDFVVRAFARMAALLFSAAVDAARGRGRGAAAG